MAAKVHAPSPLALLHSFMPAGFQELPFFGDLLTSLPYYWEPSALDTHAQTISLRDLPSTQLTITKVCHGYDLWQHNLNLQ